MLEGPHLLSEALEARIPLEEVLVTPGFLASPEGRALAPRLPVAPVQVDPEVLPSVTDADSPRGAVAVAVLPRGDVTALPHPAAREVPRGAGGPGSCRTVYLYLDGLQDPGNLGALARTAEAAGVAGVALAPGSVHPNHPRALRASAGSLLRLQVARDVSADELHRHLEDLSPTWVALEPRRGRDLYRTPLDGTLVLALGAEGPGLSGELSRRAELRLTIPLVEPVESLNVTVAAAVVLFELRRRRRERSGDGGGSRELL